MTTDFDPQDAQPTEHAPFKLKPRAYPSTFLLMRDTDVSGVSGTGAVAAGVVWPDGTVAMRWLTYTASTSIYASITDVQVIHGHQGATRIEFNDSAAEVFSFIRLSDNSEGPREHVADGVVWNDDSVSIRWRGEYASTVYWNSLDDALAIHDHDGRTHFKFAKAA